MFPQNVTADKQPPAWLTPENLTQLNHIKDFIEKLLVNSEEKRRLAAGERERKKVIGKEREGRRNKDGSREGVRETQGGREGGREWGRG